MATKKAAKAKARTKTKKAKVLTIKLTPEQRAKLVRDSGGAIDASTIKFRPRIDMGEAVARTAGGRTTRAPSRLGIAPPPKGTAWA